MLRNASKNASTNKTSGQKKQHNKKSSQGAKNKVVQVINSKE